MNSFTTQTTSAINPNVTIKAGDASVTFSVLLGNGWRVTGLVLVVTPVISCSVYWFKKRTDTTYSVLHVQQWPASSTKEELELWERAWWARPTEHWLTTHPYVSIASARQTSAICLQDYDSDNEEEATFPREFEKRIPHLKTLSKVQNAVLQYRPVHLPAGQ
jgi:hypothetical protein